MDLLSYGLRRGLHSFAAPRPGFSGFLTDSGNLHGDVVWAAALFGHCDELTAGLS